MKRIFVLSGAISVMTVACGGGKDHVKSRVQEAWNARNNPVLFSSSYEKTFTLLPLSGRTAQTPWSDSYWPSNRGGISVRWNKANPENFSYVPPTREAVFQMTESQLEALSPAEKYDLLMGRYDFPTVKAERKRTSPRDEDWEGLCHGWVPASLVLREPKPIAVANPDGLSIRFGASDVKGLLSYYYGQIASSRSQLLGGRCHAKLVESPLLAMSPECRDVNAGAFHVIISNQLGLLKEGFAADVTRDYEVWNHPVHTYSSEILGSRAPSIGSAPGTVKEVRIQTKMSYTVELSQNWNATGAASRSKTYEYLLELNADGKIIGGAWISKDRPDFLWKQEDVTFEGYFAKIKDIYTSSIQ